MVPGVKVKNQAESEAGLQRDRDAGVKEGGSANDSSPKPSPLLLKRN